MPVRIGSTRTGKITSFRKLLTDVISQYNLTKEFTIEEIQAIWPEIVGEIARQSKPIRIEDQSLLVAVNHPIIANEIIMQRDRIVKLLQERYGDTVKTIKIFTK